MLLVVRRILFVRSMTRIRELPRCRVLFVELDLGIVPRPVDADDVVHAAFVADCQDHSACHHVSSFNGLRMATTNPVTKFGTRPKLQPHTTSIRETTQVRG
jgi:hypothetical protein